MTDDATFDGTFASVTALWARAPKTHSIELQVGVCNGLAPIPGLHVWQLARCSGWGPATKYLHGPPEACPVGGRVKLIEGRLMIQHQSPYQKTGKK